MKNAYIIINTVGLTLDLIGFIGIYTTKLKKIRLERADRPYYLSKKLQQGTIKEVSEQIMKSVNKGFISINQAQINQDKKTLKYFLIVAIGVVLQIASNIIAAIS